MTESACNNGNTALDVLSRNPPNGIFVLVIGSGIGGLTVARECWRLGCEVRVFERQSQPVLTGDSFSIGSSALSSLRNYPRLQKEVNEIGTEPRVLVHKLDGTVIRGPLEFEDLISSSVDRETASKVMRLSRPKLYGAMLDHLQRVGVSVEHGREVVDYFEDSTTQRAGVVLKDGSRHEADVVIAADGVNGHSSELVLGRAVPARPSGDAIYRAAYPVHFAIADPIVASKFPEAEDRRPQVYLYLGEIQLFISRLKDEMQWSLVHKDDGRAQESWDHHPSLENVLQLVAQYKDVPTEVKHLISTTPTQRLIDWRIMWRDPQPKWTSPAGHVVQLGDAAHTFHPSSGNGATQAMEDAISLAACLSLAGKGEIDSATRVHNLLRFERVSCLQAFGIANQAKRVGTGSLSSIGKWIVLHDPEEYAIENYQAALKHLKNGTPFKNTNTPPGMMYRPWNIDGLLAARDRGEVTVLDGDWS